MRTLRLVVVGAGISGLAAARAAVETAREMGSRMDVVVLERDREVGGKAKTLRRDGYVVETGPTGFLEDAQNGALMRHLTRVACVEASVVRASKDAARRYVVRKGRVRRVDANPLRFAASGLLGPFGLVRLVAEPFVRPKRNDIDESVHAFAARRIGTQAADRLIAPMMLGVFAGDARKLSLPAAFPRLAALEREHGSLARALFSRDPVKHESERGGPSGPSGTLTSIRDGLQSLARGLARHGDFRVVVETQVEALERTRSGAWRVRVNGAAESSDADAVVLAGESYATARLLEPHAPRAADAFASVTCPPLLVVALGYRQNQAAGRVPRGFGMLVPRGERSRILGCLWDSQIFPDRAPAGGVLMRAMLGGAVDPSAGALSDEDAIACVRDDLEGLLGLRAQPSFQLVVRWPAAIPQYEIGHRERVATIERELGMFPGLHAASNALHGVAFAKAAALGWQRGVEAARGAIAGASRSQYES